ncbi:MAG: universal stress protein [Rhodocyclaceae bacterium]|jgi:nucleotide-binding universal stress UspA family protein|nr:universal stress protein [Rhodocyclaceae bacterium]
MEKPAHILVATDLSSHAGRAETRAAMLAQSLGAGKLVLIHVVPRLPLEALTSILERTPLETEQQLLDAAYAELKARAERLGAKHGIATGTAVRIGRPHVEIAEEAEALDAGLVVVGGYGAHLVRELFLGATAEKVLRKSRRPVLVVKQEPLSPYQRLLVPVDFSPCSVRALDWAQALGQGAEFTVAHVYEAPYESTLRYASVEDKVLEGYQAAARQQAQDALRAFLEPRRAAGTDFLQRMLHGHPAAGIRDLAEEMRPDLIVMGKHGQTELEELLLGSVTKHVLFETRCDMLVAPER